MHEQYFAFGMITPTGAIPAAGTATYRGTFTASINNEWVRTGEDTNLWGSARAHLFGPAAQEVAGAFGGKR